MDGTGSVYPVRHREERSDMATSLPEETPSPRRDCRAALAMTRGGVAMAKGVRDGDGALPADVDGVGKLDVEGVLQGALLGELIDVPKDADPAVGDVALAVRHDERAGQAAAAWDAARAGALAARA